MLETPIIEMRNISVKLGSKTILKDFDLVIDEGEKIAIIGESGCGKSTVLRVLLRLLRPDKGQVLFKGKEIELFSKKEMKNMYLSMGMLFQSAALFDSMNVAENVGFSLFENKLGSKRKIRDRIKTVLNLVGMNEFWYEMPSSLSGGQKKRVGLARAIASEPTVMLYDEPTTGLDPILSTNIEDLIVKLNDVYKTTSIIVSHQMSTISRTVDTIYMLHNGNLIEPESPKSIAKTKNPVLREFIRGGL